MKWKTNHGKYENAKQMQKIIEKYFKECEETGEYPKVTGLAYALGLSRQGLQNYENCEFNGKLVSLDDTVKAEMVDSIKRAKSYIEMCYEDRLFQNGNPAGAIFTLKNNYNWVDKQEIQQTNKTITVELED